MKLQRAQQKLITTLSLASLLLAGSSAGAADRADDLDWADPTPPPSIAAQKSVASVAGSTTTTPMLKGQVTYCVPKGTPIKLKLATTPDFGMKMLERDLDGNLVPARLNDKITAKTTEDIFVDENKVIPAGTVFSGRVSKVHPPKRVSRPGYVDLKFDSFTTPDGRKFAFNVEADSHEASTTKSKAKGTGLVLAHAAGGAVVGALVVYQVMGWQQTVAMHGYNIAAGAAAGALAGTAYALMKHGPEAVLEPGTNLNMSIDMDLLVPAAVSPTPKPRPTVKGLEIAVNKTKFCKDGLGGYYLFVDADIKNNTHRKFDSIDLFVEDDNGNRYSIVSDPEEDKTDMLFTIEPDSEQHIKMDFGVEYPKLRHKLVWVEHGNGRQVIFEQKLPQ